MHHSLSLIRQLVHDFKSQQTYYLSPGYQEQEARKDFIDKFFMALGWDVNHERQKNPYEQEVRIEKSVKSGKTQRRADYAFYITPNFRDPKFFVEAKKPYLNLSDPDHYYQAIRYGWNKKIPISLLTDFEEFHILDCRFMPDIATIMSRKIEYIHYEQYADEETFARIFHLFGREAVANGSIEKYAASLPKPKGKAVQQALFKTGYKPIDEAFLERLDEYRLILAKSFKKHNQQLESEELTEAVQRTIDRLVFIRFLEDKSIEESRIEHIGAEPNAWKAFSQLCRSLEPKYNGLVFKPHPIIDGKDFIPPDDREFVDICDELSHEQSPYLFDEIPISILGSIYERFLGKVVHATPKRADVEEKPEVRKAGGVYYTPEYIVRYIVSNTVGKLIDGKTPDEIAPMAFADIACGSGSFLIEVYSELLEYHERWYNENPGKAKTADVQNRDGRLVLSLKKRQEILTNNIYGVDIDFQATEVTQLSLYLKLLEDVTMNDAYQFSLIKEKILPDLRNNIVCGNSLIGTDILEGDLFEKSDEKKLNPMNFEDAFPKVMRRGGFDAIVGNPPYLYSAGKEQLKYLQPKFKLSEYQTDFYVYFIEKGISLIKKSGRLGMIVSDSWLKGKYFSKLRNCILNQSLDKITVFDYPPFEGATIENSIFIIENNKPLKEITFEKYIEPNNKIILNKISPEVFLKKNFIDPYFSSISNKIIEKIDIDSARLEGYCKINRGVHAYRTDGYGKSRFSKGSQTKRDKDEQSYHSNKKIDDTYLPEIKGKHLVRYSYHWDGTYLSYGNWLAESRTPDLFFSPKLAIRKIIAPRLVCTFIKENVVLDQSVYVAINKENNFNLLFFLGLLTTPVAGWYLKVKHGIYDTLYPWFTKEQLADFPIKCLDFTNPADKARHDHIVKLVEQMLSAKEQLSRAKTDAERTRLEMLCNSLDRQMDQAVYELYGLTEEEIKVVEGD